MGRGGARSAGDDLVFAQNWLRGKVELDLAEPRTGGVRRVVTTQGRLYTVLWKGDPGVLESPDPGPPVPRLATMDKRWREELPGAAGHFRPAPAGSGKPACLFVMPYDPTRQRLKEKLHAVHAVLSRGHRVEVRHATPEETGLRAPEGFLPTVTLACVSVDSPDAERVQAALKEALYRPSEDRKAGTDRFSLAKHGHFDAG